MKKSALLIIGDEILTGRTHDINTYFLAGELAKLGLPLAEVRVVPDETDEIVAALNALRAKYAYVFTTGGIGPTHDDITMDAVALAFGVALPEHPDALAALSRHYDGRNVELNEARRRMARVPVGGTLIENPITAAPGVRIENVFVLAGVPKIMQAMFAALKPQLDCGLPLIVRTLSCGIGEGDLSAPFGAIAKQFPQLSLGSYPVMKEGTELTDRSRWRVSLVVRGYDAAAVEAGFAAVVQMVRDLGDEPEIVT